MSLFRNFFGYKLSGETVDEVAANLNRLQTDVGDASPEDKSTERMKTFRLLEIFGQEESTKARVDNLMNSDIIPDYLTVVNRLKEARDMNVGTESVRIVRGKEKRSDSKRPKCSHCGKTNHNSNSCWQWLGTEEGRKHYENKVKELGDKGKAKTSEQARMIVEHHSNQETAWFVDGSSSPKDNKW